ncbi:MAG: Holliday junction resolvase Hjc, partial [Nanoarchaeota archaeon]
WKTGTWAACRVAGSGSNRYPSPDILAANNLRRLAIEVKATKERAQYITKDQVGQLREFSARYGAEAWIAVRFDNRGWFFVSVEELRETGGAYVLDYDYAKSVGLTFEEFTTTKDL